METQSNTSQKAQSGVKIALGIFGFVFGTIILLLLMKALIG